MCKYLNTSIPDDKLLNALYKAISLYLNYTGQMSCFDWSTDPFGQISATTWNIQVPIFWYDQLAFDLEKIIYSSNIKFF